MSSKFKDLMAQARSRETEPESKSSETHTTATAPRKTQPARRAASSAAKAKLQPDEGALPSASPAPISAKRRGRPHGKRSHPDFEQITAYISKQTYRDTKIALLQAGEKQQFSELVEQLLRKWIDSN